MTCCRHCGKMSDKVIVIEACTIAIVIDPGYAKVKNVRHVEAELCEECQQIVSEKIKEAVNTLIKYELVSRPISKESE